MSTSYQAEHLYHLWKTLNHTAARQRSDVIFQDIKMYAYIAVIFSPLNFPQAKKVILSLTLCQIFALIYVLSVLLLRLNL